MPKGGASLPILPILGVGGLALAAYNSIYQVKGGEKAIVWNRLTGISPDSKDIGMHFRVRMELFFPYLFCSNSLSKPLSHFLRFQDLIIRLSLILELALVMYKL